jgi:Leucine-rich repeat (LRR) protein
MPAIARLKKLRRFGCRLADVTGAGISHLAACTELTRLELRETSIDDDGLEVISRMPKLTWLDISECRLVTADGIAKLARLTGLTYLELREIKKVRDESFAELGTLTAMKELNLEATRISSESVPTILKMSQLERLHLAGTQLDDAGFTQLAQLPALKYLDISNCEVSAETVEKLRAAKPTLELKVN